MGFVWRIFAILSESQKCIKSANLIGVSSSSFMFYVLDGAMLSLNMFKKWKISLLHFGMSMLHPKYFLTL